MSTARLLWCAQWMVVVLCAEPVMWQPSARQPPCPSSRSKSQYAAVGSTPNEKCRRATVTGCTGLPGLHPSVQESNTLRQVTTRVESPQVLHPYESWCMQSRTCTSHNLTNVINCARNSTRAQLQRDSCTIVQARACFLIIACGANDKIFHCKPL